MARTARIAAPHLSHHLCQRGHNGRDIFLGPNDYRSYLATLEELSAFRAHVGESDCEWLDVDPVSARIVDDVRRHEHYRAFVAQGENELELKFIRESLQRGHITGCDDYAESLARRTGVTLPKRSPGRRPKKKTGAWAPVIVVK